MFEKYDSPLLPAFNVKFRLSILGMLEAVGADTKAVASLTATAFGSERMREVTELPSLKRGGLTLLNSDKLDAVERNYIDVKETKTKTKGGEVDVDSKLKLVEAPKAGSLGSGYEVITKSRDLEETEATLTDSDASY